MNVVKEYSDEELIRSIRSEKQIDLPVKFIYHQYFGVLGNYIQQNHGNEQDSEDIFQETVLSFIELVRMDKFRGESSVKTFLYAVNRNIWLNELKKRGRKERHHAIFGEQQQEKTVHDIETHISKREARAQVMTLIEELGEVCRKILVLFYYEGRSMKEILKELNYLNEQVVRNKKTKCMKSLEEKFLADPDKAKLFKSALQYE
jgi:RNA polymerase sigma factor (sigma-70 family)